ncbi:hypothetical protein UFOVP257_247 [uncultured Caudovirales phage]|uniref:Uncharacterized protein n=1 Tax=uncultured Caudovirales phage TaxID=2100421 RepID=A0A6J5LH62_9CAUD|nr:hypothetical protein UFOVP257_247 [uncultured Caudovirales phage]
MILIAVHINDPRDVPAKVTLEFTDQISCEQSLKSLTYQVKFESFKVEGKCIKKY